MSKPFVINPWMLDLADRLVDYARLHRLPFPSGPHWGFVEGLRRADQDVDRTPPKWRDGWNAASRASLARAQGQQQAHRSSRRGVSFHETACATSGTDRLVFERDPSGGLHKQLTASIIELRQGDRQAWISVLDAEMPSSTARQCALRLGASWWLQPPPKQQWEAYCQHLVEWGDIVLRSPDWDQWVWPWGNMIEQGLRLCLMGKKPTPARFCPPEGCVDGKPAAWGSLGMRVWQGAESTLEGCWEDMWIGLLLSRAHASPALAYQGSHAINGTQGE